MTKKTEKKWPTEKDLELQRLKAWKYSSTKSKILWLEEALMFGKKFEKKFEKLPSDKR